MTPNVFTYALVAALLVVVAGFGAWYLLSAPAAEPAMGGRIEGTTSYPSEYLPPQVVCAEPVAGGQEYCADAPGGYEGELTPPWGIDVPAGEYYVSAHLKDPADIGSDFGDYRAYYSQYVLCGMEYACKDHTKVVVTVPSGETVSGIQPYDWYAR